MIGYGILYFVTTKKNGKVYYLTRYDVQRDASGKITDSAWYWTTDKNNGAVSFTRPEDAQALCEEMEEAHGKHMTKGSLKGRVEPWNDLALLIE